MNTNQRLNFIYLC